LLSPDPYHSTSKFGAIAQLGERNTGSVEVSGSIPLSSTNSKSPASYLMRGFLVKYPLNFNWHNR
jgi:hypothetical protein